MKTFLVISRPRTMTYKDVLLRTFPIVTWLPKYSKENLEYDLIGGLAVGLMVLPQGLAYASVANLPEQVRCDSCRWLWLLLLF